MIEPVSQTRGRPGSAAASLKEFTFWRIIAVLTSAALQLSQSNLCILTAGGCVQSEIFFLTDTYEEGEIHRHSPRPSGPQTVPPPSGKRSTGWTRKLSSGARGREVWTGSDQSIHNVEYLLWRRSNPCRSLDTLLFPGNSVKVTEI